jgi:TolA-binding protein
MKRIALKIALLLAASLISALPALAAEGMGNSMMGQDQQGQNMKDECLLVAQNCGDRVDSIQQRIARISHEISKGTAVYSRQELMHLNSQLEDANRTLEMIMSGGA